MGTASSSMGEGQQPQQESGGQGAAGGRSGQAAGGGQGILASQMAYGGARPTGGGGPGLFHPRQDSMISLPHGRPQVPQTPQLQLTETIRNDVNLKKQTLRVVKAAGEGEKYMLDFIFDARSDCTISIWYLADERTDSSNNTLSFDSQYPIQPETIRFQAGLGQRYLQKVDKAFDVSLVESRGHMYYHQTSNFFPVVIMLQTCEDNPNRVQSQSTFATFKSNGDGTLSIAVVKQKIQVQGNAYELQEIYGIEQSGHNDAENSKECVICMSSPKDTTVLPCRHMCMCSDCAKVLRYQTNKCPICRQAVESLLQIKVNPEDRGPA